MIPRRSARIADEAADPEEGVPNAGLPLSIDNWRKSSARPPEKKPDASAKGFPVGPDYRTALPAQVRQVHQ
jgi:hypothetical protein